MNVTKRQIAHRIALATRQNETDVARTIQLFLDTISIELLAGNRIEFREFGVFEPQQRAARIALNPRTLERVQVPPRMVVKFKPGRMLRSGPPPGGSGRGLAEPHQIAQD